MQHQSPLSNTRIVIANDHHPLFQDVHELIDMEETERAIEAFPRRCATPPPTTAPTTPSRWSTSRGCLYLAWHLNNNQHLKEALILAKTAKNEGESVTSAWKHSPRHEKPFRHPELIFNRSVSLDQMKIRQTQPEKRQFELSKL
ncbi:hypothetical protein L596_010292 [Steinernema carpocapsae]|uniref:Uncharacterized protein n=1 Tax=Steinernema carpocapsae TaxID=34508 RepID=A0A4U5PID2_STECR|nr:hypothetical protein L596_010292 [Steinernema carpocapsae]